MVLGSFSGAVSSQDNYIDGLKECIKKGVSFKILFLNAPNIESKAYQLLLDAKNDGHDIEFKNGQGIIFKDGKVRHFAVFDNDKFRFETDK